MLSQTLHGFLFKEALPEKNPGACFDLMRHVSLLSKRFGTDAVPHTLQFGTQLQLGPQFEGTLECRTMTSGRTSRARAAVSKFFALQA